MRNSFPKMSCLMVNCRHVNLLHKHGIYKDEPYYTYLFSSSSAFKIIDDFQKITKMTYCDFNELNHHFYISNNIVVHKYRTLEEFYERIRQS